jgi:hypothetical protein
MEKEMQTKIHEYVHRRDVPKGKHSRIGVLVAEVEPTAHGDVVSLGWSRCNTSAGDEFDWKQGVIEASANVGKALPVSFARRGDVQGFKGRAARFFKQAIVLPWGTTPVAVD